MNGKPISQEEYLKDERCPVCEDNVIEGGPVEVNNGQATQNIHCQICGSYWTDVYKLHQYDNLHDEEGKELDIPEVTGE